jgi:putative ubiquitin-RnfH superfamily antitoxin RatB of RatAB toxin-antitoxin module
VSPKGRPEGEHRSAQHEGSPVSRATITVTVASVAAGLEELVRVELPVGATAAEAVVAAGLGGRLRRASALALAIHGRLAQPDTPLADGDRVELCRPLVVTPADARRARAGARARRPADLPGAGK